MAGTNSTHAAADIAADGPDATVGVSGTARPGGAAGAVWDALMANPGGSVMTIANAAGVSRATATKALAGFAESGRAVRTPGGRTEGGRALPDMWTTTDADTRTPTGAVTGTEAATDTEPVINADTGADTHAGTDADVDPDTRTDTGVDAPEGAGGDPVPAAVASATPQTAPAVSAGTIADAMRILEEEAGRREAAEAELRRAAAEEEARRAKVLADLAKARTTEDTRRALADLLGAVTAAYAAVIAGDQDRIATGLEAIYAETANVRKASRVASGRTTGTGGSAAVAGGGRGDRAAPRPLRPEVVAHLAAYPDAEFTPGEIAKVLGRSSGAVSNALDTLVKNGEAVLTSERPHRYRATTPAPVNASVTAATDTDTTDACEAA